MNLNVLINMVLIKNKVCIADVLQVLQADYMLYSSQETVANPYLGFLSHFHSLLARLTDHGGLESEPHLALSTKNVG